jgi:DNA polymerase elongation subunit (family B)
MDSKNKLKKMDSKNELKKMDSKNKLKKMDSKNKLKKMDSNIKKENIKKENIKKENIKKLEWMRKNGRKEEQTFYKTKKLGILPKILKEKLAERRKIKGIMKEFVKKEKKKGININTIKNMPRYKSLDADQLQLKILCNSLYGVCGSRFSPLSCLSMAGCITYNAKKYLLECEKLINKWFNGVIIYGDTDSLFIEFPHINKKNITDKEKFDELYKFSTTVLIPKINKYWMEKGMSHMKMDHEKIFVKLQMGSKKKNYQGEQCCGNNFNERELKIMGLKYKKRDASEIEKIAGKETCKILLEDESKIKKYLQRLIKECYHGKYPYTYFMKSKKYNPPYKNSSTQVHCRAVELIRKYNPGLLPVSNERVFYTFKRMPYIRGPRGGIIEPKRCDQVWPKILLDTRTGDSDKIRIDYKIFINSIKKNSSSLFEIVFGSEEKVNEFFREEIAKYEDIFGVM